MLISPSSGTSWVRRGVAYLSRILTKGKKVDLPVWQRPAAMGITLGFYGIGLVGEITSALRRDFEPLKAPERPGRTSRAAA